MSTPIQFNAVSGATFSDCRRYRYILMRQWAPPAHPLYIPYSINPTPWRTA